MKYFVILSRLFFLSLFCNAQNKDLETENFIHNLVYKNIAAYNIRYASFSKNGLIFNDPLKTSSDFFFDKLLPDQGSKMVMEITAFNDQIYPLNNYSLFSISTKGLQFEYPETGVSRFFTGPRIGSRYLVAVDTLNRDIKFLSGQFFNSMILSDFSFDPEKPESYLNFIKLRGYQWLIEQVTFYKKSGSKLYFTCYSRLYEKDVMVILDLKKPEFLTLTDAR